MKTLVVIHPHFTIKGGAGRFILELTKRLSDKYKIITISQRVDPSYVSDYPQIKFVSVNGPLTDSFLFWLLFPYWQLKTYFLIRKYLQSSSPIFVSVFPSNWLIFPLKILFPRNKIYWFCQEPSAFVQDKKWINTINNQAKRGIAILLNPIFKKYDFYLSKVPNHLFANSKYSQENIFKVYHRPSTIICPGIDISKFKPIPFSHKEDYILTVSRLTKFKNIDVLIKAYSTLKNNDFRLKIVGQGEELDNLKKLTQKLKINSQVEFLNNISDTEIINIFQKAKLFVLCSKNEPFGIVPIEAMACGTPVIADDSGGPRETIINNKIGVLINCNVTNLSNTINQLLNNPDQMKSMSRSSYKWTKNNFGWENSVKKIKSYL